MSKEGTAAYDQGIEACEAGLYRTNNPYAPGSSPYIQWLRGWLDFLPIREDWEAENHAQAKQFSGE